MRRLWGRLSSVNVQKAVWALEELGLACERVEAGGAFGRVRDPDYLALNPNGLVPVLEEDGYVLWESNAILRYLAEAHGPAAAARGGVALMPEEERARGHVHQWLDWQATTFTPAMRDAFWQTVRLPAEGRDPDLIARSVAAGEAAAAILDAHLAGRPFAVGDAFTAADIALGCAAHRWLHLAVPREPRPNLQAWYARVAARPAAAKVLTVPIT
ncbi:Glutathione S-transferase domain [Methylobacterium sp. 4-46]|uniref:glutathione S-transferase family protein n=1 Tax=unclassified Methylobacterium TaxID=2615210 RepID=UPI000152C753|nr:MULTISPECIES: glutathione S-transferase family protein [Methylobacterium]ACA14946.1 Glutathione S-transferase domain [Methylobacterium sp. 4-46]WFT80684.1 glutathione S-transferase family protein [Methylobacterium nodulans]